MTMDYEQKYKEALGWMRGMYDGFHGKTKKPKWSEEDESKVKDVIYFLDTAKVHYASTKALDDCIDWLKSLKQRMKEQ